jgi:thiamine-phosphate pyrophosphorylase
MSPPGWIVSRAVHSTEGAVTAEREGGVDFLVFGTVFPSAGKDAAQRPAGLDGLRDACAAVRLPVVAIGGMTAPRARAAAATGAAGVAAIGLFVPGDPSRDGVETLVRDLRRSFDTSSQVV